MVSTSNSRIRSSYKRKAQLLSSSSTSVTLDDFTELQAPHPYGVLPSGNRFFDNCRSTNINIENSQLHSGTVNATDLCNDEDWITIFSYLDGISLATISNVSRFMYVIAHQPELWRDLVLHLMQDGIINQVGPTWKDTYIFHWMKFKNVTETKHCRTVPKSIGGVYSDYLYRLHSCRSFAIPTSWTLGNDDFSDNINNSVTKIPVQEMSEDRFYSEFENRNQPVLIQGAAKSWRAYKLWQDPTYLESHTQQQTFRATSGVAPLPAQFTLSAYFDYCTGSSSRNDENNVTNKSISHLLEEGPLYLFDRTALQPNSVLWEDYMYDLQKTCPYWDPAKRTTSGGHDLFGVLGEGRRPDHTWLICGPKRSGSVFHIDPNGTHAWNAAICGRKRWIFYPPGVTPPGVYPSEDGDQVALPLTLGEWIFQFWDAHCERKRNAPLHEQPIECTAMPSDILFVPHGWWHLVVNLDDINIAITHNYVSFSNLSNVLKFIDQKRDQVSGCRDREDSIKPERLYEEFVDALQQENPRRLQLALAEPQWTCRAWKKSRLWTSMKLKTTNGNSVKSSVIEQAKIGNPNFSFSFENL